MMMMMMMTESISHPDESLSESTTFANTVVNLAELDFQQFIVPYDCFVELFPTGNEVSPDVNGNVSLLVPSSMLNDEGFLQCESASSVNDLQVGGMGTDTALQNVVDESNSSPNVSVTATASDNTSNTNTSSTTDTIRAKVKVSRKRMSNIPLRKQSMRKKLRNSGQEYVRSGGSLAESRSLGPDCSCRKQCMSALTRSHCQSLFSNFWAMNDFNQQNAFLFGQIQSIKPARRYVDARDSRRQFTFLFYVKDDCGESVRVCKQAFLSIFGLQNC